MNDTRSEQTKTAMPIVDSDVHVYPKDEEEIRSRLPEPWSLEYKGTNRPFYMGNPLFAGEKNDSVPPGGGRAGSDPDFLRQQLIDEYGIKHAILLPRVFCNMYPNPDYANSLASAFNDWLIDTWLTEYNHDGCFKGSINVAQQDPAAAAREIDRVGDHEHVVQVMVDSGSRAPFGQRQYWPIYEACQRHGLPLAIHPGTDGMGINAQPAPGYPTHYIEWHTGLSLSFQAHLTSFLTEGVFEKFPGFKVVLTEGGVAWLAPYLWRLDNHYKELRAEVPWMKKRPHEYLSDHVRLTSQPLERPDNRNHLLQVFEMMDAEHILMFASDYPHFDFDSPKTAFPKLPTEVKARIFYKNASDFYGLGLSESGPSPDVVKTSAAHG
jgi:predicted TIM-barrel fold metal-dependent hydrolase